MEDRYSGHHQHSDGGTDRHGNDVVLGLWANLSERNSLPPINLGTDFSDLKVLTPEGMSVALHSHT